MKTIGVWGFVMLVIGVGACGGNNDTTGKTTGAVTFWGDVEPIFNTKCVKCHQSGGIGPFRLDNYADAKAYAPIEKVRVNQGTMPPYFMVHDGSCQTFQDDPTLSADQIATITAWVDGGTSEGTPRRRCRRCRRNRPYRTQARCRRPRSCRCRRGESWLSSTSIDASCSTFPQTGDTFITGYDVSPGDAAIVHHVLGFVVDPTATGDGGMTNAQIMANLQAQSPNRVGWPCFGGAGDGVNVDGLPIAWAPGQGIVEYPTGMGVPVKSTDKLVVQIHYNMADPTTLGQTDSSTVQLQFADSVQRELRFLLPDPFLDTIGNPTPDSLPPGQADTKYTWTVSGSDMGVKGVPSVDLMAVMPHMHQRGVRQTMSIGPLGNMSCASHLENWSFHWQEFYSYKTPIAITPDTQISVTCEYNTSTDTQPVLPGWGTRNEMCLNVLMVALPAQQ